MFTMVRRRRNRMREATLRKTSLIIRTIMSGGRAAEIQESSADSLGPEFPDAQSPRIGTVVDSDRTGATVALPVALPVSRSRYSLRRAAATEQASPSTAA